jgi:tetratricopeptide (TPR) repeat protein
LSKAIDSSLGEDWGTGPSSARFHSALYSYHRGDYSVALPEFERMAERFHRSGDGARFIECSIYVLRLLAEQEAFSKVSKIEARILKFFEGPERGRISPKILSRMHYVLGICLVYQDGKHEEAMDSFRESIQFAIESGDRSALAWPLYGAATVLYARRRYDDARRELDKLATLLSCKNIPELSTSAQLLNSLILRNQKKLDESLQSAWAAFDSLKQQPHLGLYMHTLATLGTIFREKGEPAAARIYLDLAKRSLKRTEFPRVARIVDEAIELLGDETVAYDLALNLKTGSLHESRKGEIRFEGQFLLRDLLTVFMRSALKNPSTVLKKEDLVREVWGESYRPLSHDNKIYVNIKRLRRLIEGEDGSTEYILRGKQGYYLNPKARIFLVEADGAGAEKQMRSSSAYEPRDEVRSEI